VLLIVSWIVLLLWRSSDLNPFLALFELWGIFNVLQVCCIWLLLRQIINIPALPCLSQWPSFHFARLADWLAVISFVHLLVFKWDLTFKSSFLELGLHDFAFFRGCSHKSNLIFICTLLAPCQRLIFDAVLVDEVSFFLVVRLDVYFYFISEWWVDWLVCAGVFIKFFFDFFFHHLRIISSQLLRASKNFVLVHAILLGHGTLAVVLLLDLYLFKAHGSRQVGGSIGRWNSTGKEFLRCLVIFELRPLGFFNLLLLGHTMDLVDGDGFDYCLLLSFFFLLLERDNALLDSVFKRINSAYWNFCGLAFLRFLEVGLLHCPLTFGLS